MNKWKWSFDNEPSTKTLIVTAFVAPILVGTSLKLIESIIKKRKK